MRNMSRIEKKKIKEMREGRDEFESVLTCVEEPYLCYSIPLESQRGRLVTTRVVQVVCTYDHLE